MNRKPILILVLLAGVLSLGGCLRPYKLDIQQGNVVTQPMLKQVRPGMSKHEVGLTLGTPILDDPFHVDRWDYYYVYKRRGTEVLDKQNITLVFNGDTLQRIEGTAELKSDQEAASQQSFVDPAKLRKRNKGPGFFSRTWNWMFHRTPEPKTAPEPEPTSTPSTTPST